MWGGGGVFFLKEKFDLYVRILVAVWFEVVASLISSSSSIMSVKINIWRVRLAYVNVWSEREREREKNHLVDRCRRSIIYSVDQITVGFNYVRDT